MEVEKYKQTKKKEVEKYMLLSITARHGSTLL
jgi:hypothetical protein